MSNKLSNLRREGKISEMEYLNYLLFSTSDLGINYLKKMLEGILMEEPLTPTTELFVWHDGRRSVWRDIKRMIDNVDRILKGEKDDRSSRGQ